MAVSSPVDHRQRSRRANSAAVLTPRGRGAVATVRLEGDCAILDAPQPPLFRAADGRAVSKQPLGRIVFGRWGAQAPEDVVLCRTDERRVEIHCHGGDAAVRRIIDDLRVAGCSIETWSDASVRTAGVFETECLEALSRATTMRTAAILLDQKAGVLRAAIEELLEWLSAEYRESGGGLQESGFRSQGSGVSSQESEVRSQRSAGGESRIEDRGSRFFVSHPSPLIPERNGQRTTDNGQRHSSIPRLDALLRRAGFGLHLTRPHSVVIAGRPNVGKSSLINALLGYSRSIVYDQPGTTRDAVTAETALDGWPVQLTDTAGLRGGADELESAGIDRARRVLAAADCRVLLFDVSRPLTDDDRLLLAEWPAAVIVAHKCDLPCVWQPPANAAAASPLTSDHPLLTTSQRVSSLTGEGVGALVQRIVERLVPEVPSRGAAVPVTERQVRLLESARAALQSAEFAFARESLAQILA